MSHGMGFWGGSNFIRDRRTYRTASDCASSQEHKLQGAASWDKSSLIPTSANLNPLVRKQRMRSEKKYRVPRTINSHTRAPTAHKGHPPDAVSQHRCPRERFQGKQTYATTPQVNRHRRPHPAEVEASARESIGPHLVPIRRGLCS